MQDLIHNAHFERQALDYFIQVHTSKLKWTSSDKDFAIRAMRNHKDFDSDPLIAICDIFRCSAFDLQNFTKTDEFLNKVQAQIIIASLSSTRNPLSAKTLYRFFRYQRDFYNISFRQSASFCGITDGAVSKMRNAKTLRRHTGLKVLSAYQVLVDDIRDFNERHNNQMHLMKGILKAKHLSSFFRSKRTEQKMSMADIYKKTNLTMRIMSDLENNRKCQNLPFIVREMCCAFDCDIEDIKSYHTGTEVKVTPQILQKFIQQKITPEEYHAYARKASLSPSGFIAFLTSSNPDNYKMNTLRATCQLFNCTPKQISDFGKSDLMRQSCVLKLTP